MPISLNNIYNMAIGMADCLFCEIVFFFFLFFILSSLTLI